MLSNKSDVFRELWPHLALVLQTLNITLRVSLLRNKDHHPDQPETSHEPQGVRDRPAQGPDGLRDPACSSHDIPTAAETTRGGGEGEPGENQARSEHPPGCLSGPHDHPPAHSPGAGRLHSSVHPLEEEQGVRR